MRLDPYRLAYEQASDELNEIGELFNLLRVRKQRIEKVILAFKPLMETSAVVAPSFGAPVPPSVEETAEPMPAEPVEQVAPVAAVEEASGPPTYSFLEVPAPLPELPPGPSDPFQRRVFRFRGLSNEHRGVQRGA